MKGFVVVVLVAVAALAGTRARGETTRPPPRAWSVAPVAPSAEAISVHAPYGAGECIVCHERNARDPGPITKAVNALCAECHSEMEGFARSAYLHAPVKGDCTACHNPHDARAPKLLHADVGELCTACHAGVKEIVATAAVQHAAVTTGARCLACHSPHGSNVPKLLLALPYDLCVTCHGTDGLRGSDGKPLANIAALLAENPVQHGPVQAKDCSACHLPHGGPNFRLLVDPYPATFYSRYDAKNYAICFQCHDEKAFVMRETTTRTSFRDGRRNLHYVHVNLERGRTCRACHEVHASKQGHLIRSSVPFGPRGWALNVGYTPLPNGGECAKTCHEKRGYRQQQARRTTDVAVQAPAEE